MNKEYRDIVRRIPYKALIGEELCASEKDAANNEIYNYMDLCNEQIYLRMSNRVREKTWNNWQEGMKTNFSLNFFEHASTEVFQKLSLNFLELQKVKRLGYKTDPKKWKNV